ncbi:gastrula zinc finger protein XlCGF26.1-like [Engraulis encrasicolus]|uniref:gastrula zinc finger protein XlCGF26.1-like n=1 Tax=Engraulis encrasicolus TaxID=184585 RepID=UPI002FD61277
MNCPAFRDELGSIMRILSEVAVEELGRLLDESSSVVLPLEKAHPGTTSTLKRDLQREFKAKIREFALFMEVLSTSAADKVMMLTNTLKFQWQESPTDCDNSKSASVESWFEFEGYDQERTRTENPDHQEGTNANLHVKDTDSQKTSSLETRCNSDMIGEQRQRDDADIEAEPQLLSHPTTLHLTDPLKSGSTSVESWFETEADDRERTGTENPDHQENTNADLPVEDTDAQKSSSLETSLSCRTCGRTFTSKQGICEHLKRLCSDESFCCEVCGLLFSSKSSLKIHQNYRHGSRRGSFVCDVCDKRFNEARQLKTHSWIHAGAQPFVCEVCGRGFNDANNLDRHQKIHTGLKPYACPLCPKKFSRSDTLQQHQQMVHTDTKPFHCSTCGKGFSTRTCLKTHAYVHSQTRPFVCVICSKSFHSPASLKQHMMVHSFERSTRPIVQNPDHQEATNLEVSVEDTDGQKSNAPESSLSHPTSQRTFMSGGSTSKHVCDVCGKCFCNAYVLKDHSNIHTGAQPYICDVCGRGFNHKANFRRHKKIHTGLKPYACTLCPKKFCIPDGLKQHLSVHARTKPFHCGMCGKSFSNRPALRAHSYIHLKPFACVVCGKGFRSRSVLNQHRKVHSVERSPKQPMQEEPPPSAVAWTHKASQLQKQSEAAESCV